MTSTEQLKENCVSIAKTIETVDDLYEYINDILEINYIVDSKKRYIGSELLACYGGPTIRINTRYNIVEGSWGGDQFTCHYTRPDLDDLLKEYYDSI